MDPGGVRLGRTDISLPRLGLGMSRIGAVPPGSEGDAHAILRRAFAAGLRLVDVAPPYGAGAAERRIGELMSEIDRSSIVISTKVGRLVHPMSRTAKARLLLRDTMRGSLAARQLALGRIWRGGRALIGAATAAISSGHRLPPSGGGIPDYTYDGVMRSVEESLERLTTDRLDIVSIHDVGLDVATVEGAFRALDHLRSDGIVAAIGISSNYVAPALTMLDAFELDCLQIAGRYSLLDQSAADRLLPLALERGVGVVISGVFNSGILADPSRGATFDYLPASRARLAEVAKLRESCARYGVALPAAALQFALAHPAVSCVLVGVESVAQLEADLAHADALIPDELWTEMRDRGVLAPGLPVPESHHGALSSRALGP